MDSQFIISRYDNGVRAYIDKNGTPFHQHNGERRFVYASDELNGWHSLRAYQDEQRKKGVPIGRIEGWNDRRGVSENEYGLKCYFTFLHCNHVPEIYVDNIGIVARFTNFRWREGYPKVWPNQDLKGDMNDLITRLKNDGHDVRLDIQQ